MTASEILDGRSGTGEGLSPRSSVSPDNNRGTLAAYQSVSASGGVRDL